MSFSSEVKDELSDHIPSARHCQIAEMTAILTMCGRIVYDVNGRMSVLVHTENLSVARKYFTLIRKTFNIFTEISIRQNSVLKKSRIYSVIVRTNEDALRILKAAKLIDDEGEIREDLSLVSNRVVQSECCKRAFIRGAFMGAGSISDPEKSYHLEIVCATREKAQQLGNIIEYFEIPARITPRKGHYIVYLKEGEGIVDLLGLMGASKALMNLENVRILKEMRNSVNRRVNCETANITKTVSAAVRQAEDIRLIDEKIGIDTLPETLQEVAKLRLQNPEASLIQIGEMLNPPVGKSGINHRFRKLTLIADDIRNGEDIL